jgi:hypothetical protein
MVPLPFGPYIWPDPHPKFAHSFNWGDK